MTLRFFALSIVLLIVVGGTGLGIAIGMHSTNNSLNRSDPVNLSHQNFTHDNIAGDQNWSYDSSEENGTQNTENSSQTNLHSANVETPYGDINVTFGRLNVHSEGANGELSNSHVSVYNQSTGSYVDDSYTGSDGVVAFYLAPGIYKARITESNDIWKENLVISAGEETNATAVFGRLNVHVKDFEGQPLNSYVSVYNQSTGSYVDDSYTGSDGVVAFYLAPSVYKAMVRKSTDIWYYDIVVTEGKATNIGDYTNHNPVINSITANPERINPGGSTTITVSASDLDGDALFFSYSASVGTVVGSGSTADYFAPDTVDTYRTDVVVSDGNGGFAQGSIFVSDRYGDLVINSRGVGGEHLNSDIRVYKQFTGSYIDDGYTGSDGTITFSLLEDIYKISVGESNAIWVENILVVYGSTGIIIGNDTYNSAPVINFGTSPILG